MFRQFFACAAVTLAMCSSAMAMSGAWRADTHTGCKVWDNDARPDDAITWSGSCEGGYASGRGTAEYIVNGRPLARYDGEYQGGKRSGHGVLTVPGYRFDGEWRDDNPDGRGSILFDNGQSISGNWSNGCLRQGNRTWTVTMPPELCDPHLGNKV
jgi:hypothetical protein